VEASVLALKEISTVTRSVARGDLSKTLKITEQDEIERSKQIINTMVAKLNQFSSEVIRVTREVGTNGKLGGQANIDDVEGTWKELTVNVNTMAEQLTHQTRNVASITTAVTEGDMSKELKVEAQGTSNLLS
jgi:HAMP domain-containing protein